MQITYAHSSNQRKPSLAEESWQKNEKTMGLEIGQILVAQGPCIQYVGLPTGPYRNYSIDDG